MKLTKKTSIILVLISLVVMSGLFYLLKYVIRDRTFEYNTLAIVFSILGIFVLYLAYKELLRHFGRGSIVKEEYATLYGLEKPRITGEVEFYFTINQAKHILFSVLNSRLEEVAVVADTEYPIGGHILRYDTSALQNGIYFYCLRSENQKTMKRMHIQHDNLTV
jgi:hypothetical protein